MTVQGGTPTAGAGGSVNLAGANAVSGNNNGGNVVLTAGAATGAGTAGSVQIASAVNFGGAVAPTAGAILDMSDAAGTLSSLILPTGTSGNRPGPVEGMLRYSSSPAKQVEAYVNGAWAGLLTTTSSIGAGSITLGTSTAGTNPSRTGDVTTGLFSAAASSVSLAVGGTEAFRVTGSGFVGIGTTSPATLEHIYGAPANGVPLETITNTSANTFDSMIDMLAPNIVSGGDAEMHMGRSNSINNAFGLSFYYSSAGSGSNSFNITPYGQNPAVTVLATGSVGIGTPSPDLALSVNGDADKASGGTTWLVFSDRRLKDIEGPYERGLAEIVQLDPVRYHYRKNNPRNLPGDTQEFGLIAQDVRKVFPEAVTEGSDSYLRLQVSPINFAMINAFKELKASTDDLRDRNGQLEQQMEVLRARLGDSAPSGLPASTDGPSC